MRNSHALAVAVALAITLATALPADAQCRINVGKCVTAGTGLNSGSGGHFKKARTAPPKFAIGDRLPDTYYVLLNSRRYGLPPVNDGTLYFRVERRVYLVDSATRRILEDVTSQTNRAF